MVNKIVDGVVVPLTTDDEKTAKENDKFSAASENSILPPQETSVESANYPEVDLISRKNWSHSSEMNLPENSSNDKDDVKNNLPENDEEMDLDDNLPPLESVMLDNNKVLNQDVTNEAGKVALSENDSDISGNAEVIKSEKEAENGKKSTPSLTAATETSNDVTHEIVHNDASNDELTTSKMQIDCKTQKSSGSGENSVKPMSETEAGESCASEKAKIEDENGKNSSNHLDMEKLNETASSVAATDVDSQTITKSISASLDGKIQVETSSDKNVRDDNKDESDKTLQSASSERNTDSGKNENNDKTATNLIDFGDEKTRENTEVSETFDEVSDKNDNDGALDVLVEIDSEDDLSISEDVKTKVTLFGLTDFSLVFNCLLLHFDLTTL